MFKLMPFERLLCELGSSYELIAEECLNKYEDCMFLDFRLPWSNLWCGDAYTFLYLWFVLIFGVFGMMHNVYHFGLVYFSKEINPPSRWQSIKFFPAPPPLARRLSLVKRFIQVNAWGLLLYAAIFKSPAHMYPWLGVQMLTLILNVTDATKNYILGFSSNGQRVRTTLSLCFHATTTWIVHKAMRTLFSARKQDINQYFEIPLINSNK